MLLDSVQIYQIVLSLIRNVFVLLNIYFNKNDKINQTGLWFVFYLNFFEKWSKKVLIYVSENLNLVKHVKLVLWNKYTHNFSLSLSSFTLFSLTQQILLEDVKK